MVQFTQSRLAGLFYSTVQWWNHFHRVTPFGNLRITGCLLLPVAFRSLLRPSSPYSSKTFAINFIFTWPYYRFLLLALFAYFPLPQSKEALHNNIFKPVKLFLSKTLFFLISLSFEQLSSFSFLFPFPIHCQISLPRINLRVEIRGVEPLTYGLQSRRSTNWATSPAPAEQGIKWVQGRTVLKIKALTYLLCVLQSLKPFS